jgi:hypothetical protein
MLEKTKINLKQDQKIKCEINKDLSAKRIRRANVRTAKIQRQIGSEEQMRGQQRSSCKQKSKCEINKDQSTNRRANAR